MPTLIVFDIDGTLTDSMTQHHEAFMVALEFIGVDNYIPFQRKFKHFTDSFVAKDIFEFETGKTFSKEHLETFSHHLNREIRKKEIHEVRGALSLIKEVIDNPNFDFCFATGSLLGPAKHKLESTRIPFQETQLSTADKLEERESIVKEAIDKAKARNGADFERIISIGDGLWDLKTAQNLELDFIGIGDKHRNELLNNGCTVHFNTPEELRLSGYIGNNN